MYRIRRFNVLKTATVVALMYMVLVAIFIVPIALLLVAVPRGSGFDGVVGLGGILTFGIVAILGYGILGWIFTAIACALYNLVARWVGGIEVEVELVAPPPAVPVWSATPPPPTGPLAG